MATAVQNKRARQQGNLDAGESAHLHPTKRANQETSHVAKLYAHALESVFGFMSLRELSVMPRVTRSWGAAALSAKSIGETSVLLLEDNRFVSVAKRCVAPLVRRHVATVGAPAIPLYLTPHSLYLACSLLQGLRTLHCVPPFPLPARLEFPPTLTHLNLVPCPQSDVAAINSMILAASKLPRLGRLSVQFLAFNTAVDFAPLAAAASDRLHTLELGFHMALVVTLATTIPGSLARRLRFRPEDRSPDLLQVSHADDLRAMQNLTSIQPPLDKSDLRLLLRPPHALRWQALKINEHIDAEIATLLGSLSELADLTVCEPTDLCFLERVPGVSRLHIRDVSSSILFHSPRLDLARQLTDLELTSCPTLTSKQLANLLSFTPNVSRLAVRGATFLTSLAFLASAPLVRTLECLRLSFHGPGVSATEVDHILSLQKLASLEIHASCFAQEFVDARTQRDLAAMPLLATFRYYS